MAEALGKLIDWLKSPRQCAAALIAALTVFLLPVRFLQRNGLEFLIRYRGLAFLLAILSGAVLITESLYQVWSKRRKKRQAAASRQQSIEYLHTLTPEEKGLLLPYFVEHTDTQYLSSADGLVGGLIGKGVLYRSSSVGHHSYRGPIFAYNLQPWVRDYIEGHSEVLDGSAHPTPPPSPFRSWYR